MKQPLPVTLDDLQSTAKDDIAMTAKYRDIVVLWNIKTNTWSYWHDGFPCNEPFVRIKLSEYRR